MKPRRGAVGVVASAVLVVGVSGVLSMRRGDVAAGPGVPRFSGSRVIARMGSLLADPALPQRVSVAIIRDASAATFYDRPATLDSIVEVWRRALEGVGAEVRVIPSTSASAARTARVLVVPS